MSSDIYPDKIFGLMPNVVKTDEDGVKIQTARNGVELRIAQTENPKWHFSLIYQQLFNDLRNPNYSVTELQFLMGFRGKMRGRWDSFLFEDPEDNSVKDQTLQLVVDTTNPVAAAVVGGSAGTGFALDDVLLVTGGGGEGAVLRVASLSGSAIASFVIDSGGSGYATTAGATLMVLTGAGSGAPTANITAGPVYYTPLQRNQGGLFLEDVTDLNLQGDAHYFPNAGTNNKIFTNGVQKSQSYPGNGGDFDLLAGGFSIPGAAFMGLYLKWHAAPTAPITGTFKFYFRVRFEESTQDWERFLWGLYTIGGDEGQRGSGTVKLVSSRDAT